LQEWTIVGIDVVCPVWTPERTASVRMALLWSESFEDFF
jgi:hypothetical protein